MRRIRQFLELIRFSHTVFALPFALLAACLAWNQELREGRPIRWQDACGILLCMVFARSAAMAFNRIVDRGLDAENPRTAGRHLPAGLMRLQTAVLFAALCAAGFFASTLLFLPNTWPLRLSIPVLAFVCGYSYSKRFTVLCHYWLGAALMLAPVAAWLAIRGSLSAVPLWLGAAVCCWVAGFDIIYACQDAEFDRGRRLSSIPARWGVARALRLAGASHLLMLACLVGLWISAGLGWPFLTAIALIGALLIYEHWLVSPSDLRRVNQAFFHVNAVISIGLLVVGVVDVWGHGRGLW